MAGTVKKISLDVSRSAAISYLSENDQILEGRDAEKDFDKVEIDQVYTDTSLSRKYTRKSALGNTLTTYTNWSHLRSEAGYSIWSYPCTSFVDNTLNCLVSDDDLYDYKGEANSESIATFTKVLDVLDGVCTDVTTESGTELGTSFCFLQDAVSTTYLYCGGTSTFKAIDFDLETLGSNYTLRMKYWNGAAWGQWDGTCTTSTWVDNTENFHYNGLIEFGLPTDWTQTTVDGTTAYWIQLYSTSTPSVPAKAYHILPGTSVPTLLSMSEKQILDKDWRWCYYGTTGVGGSGKVYVTIRNSGDPYYAGNYFIKSNDSTENLQNYFINNHLLELSYQNIDYVYTAWAPSKFLLPSNTKNQLLQMTGSTWELRAITDVPSSRIGSLALWNGATWVAIINANYLTKI